tara:strand:+ start:1763 stop:1867 length:105 start_codon:yes stop_codon:yes gene_type:complete
MKIVTVTDRIEWAENAEMLLSDVVSEACKYEADP